MAFREKIAWVTLIAMVLAYGVYFGAVVALGENARGPVTADSLWMLWLFAALTIAQLAAIAITSLILSLRSGREARARADERDQAIARRGAAVAYHVLLTGMIVVGVVLPFEASGWRIVNAALFALVLAEFVRHAAVVIGYRRGWHG
jgi:hypothetical protein